MSKLTLFHQSDFTGHKQSVYCVISDGEQGFFTAGSDGFIVQWSNPNENEGVVFARVPEAVDAGYSELEKLPGGNTSAVRVVRGLSWSELGRQKFLIEVDGHGYQ